MSDRPGCARGATRGGRPSDPLEMTNPPAGNRNVDSGGPQPHLMTNPLSDDPNVGSGGLGGQGALRGLAGALMGAAGSGG